MTNINEAQHDLAITLASVDNAALASAVNTVATAKHEYQGGPLKVLVAMRAAYSADQLAMFPKPGTGHPKLDPDYQGNNPEYYKVDAYGKDGKRTSKSISFYVEFAQNTKAGKELADYIDKLKRASDTTGKVKQDDCVDELALSPQEREVDIRKCESKMGIVRAAYRSAIKLEYQLAAVNALPLVEAVMVPGVKPGEFENEIMVRSTVEGRSLKDYDFFSISAFLRLDADKAAEKDGSFAALKATLKREPGSDQGSASGTTVTIKTNETLGNVFNDVHAYFDDIQNSTDKTKLSELAKLLSPRGGANANLLRSNVMGIYKMLDWLMRKDEIRQSCEQAYEAMLDKAA